MAGDGNLMRIKQQKTEIHLASTKFAQIMATVLFLPPKPNNHYQHKIGVDITPTPTSYKRLNSQSAIKPLLHIKNRTQQHFIKRKRFQRTFQCGFLVFAVHAQGIELFDKRTPVFAASVYVRA